MAGRDQVYSVCGMCGARCPIVVERENGEARAVFGNPHTPLQGALCARGAAGIAIEGDRERPLTPLIRQGERGQGLWRAVSWDEALDYVAQRLAHNARKFGPESLLWSDRDGPFTDLYRAFMRGMGSPNTCAHSVSCDLNIHHAAKAVTGYGRGMVVHDYAHCRHLVLQGRNLFEAINTVETMAVSKARRQGCRLTSIEVRPTVTGSKSQRCFVLRPGTDYAFNQAVIHEIIEQGYYNAAFVQQCTVGFEALRESVRHCSLAWAAAHTGIAAEDIRTFVRELAADAPHVIWHPGWMTSRYGQSFQVSRTAFVINALLGSVGSRGGIVFGRTPQQVGHAPLRRFSDLYPAPSGPRADGVGGPLKAFDPGKGLLHRAFAAMESGTPYPIRSYIAWRHDPLQALPDPEEAKRLFSYLDLLVSVTFTWSDTAWHSDVVLPLSPYLARESIIATKAGLKPQFFVRQRAVAPSADTRADWEIISGLSQRLGLDALVFASAEDVWNFQLQGTGLGMEDFAAKGFVELADKPYYPEAHELAFPTPTGKLELDSRSWQEASGQNMLPPFAVPEAPPVGAFRLLFGRVGVHTQGHTMNNPLLFEQMPVNSAWIHPARATELGLKDGDLVEVLDKRGRSAGQLPLRVTEGIHPEGLFMVHGFGHRLPCESLARHQGAADHELLTGGLMHEDKGGGGLAMQEHFVTIRPVRGSQEAQA